MSRFLKIYYLLIIASVQTILSSRLGIVIFVSAKLLRFFFYFLFVYFLFKSVRDIAGYGKNESLLFFVTFAFLGDVGQMLFREVYRFRGTVVSGNFDFDLIKPAHPLIKNLLGGFDLFDLLTMPVFITTLIYLFSRLEFSLLQLILYIALCLNGVIIMAGIHILVAALNIVNQEVDNAVLVYRDLETMARFPVDVYQTPIREILTFVLPVGLIFTFPVKAFLGLLSWQAIIASFFAGIVFLIISLRIWNMSIHRYSSASS